MFFIEKLPTKLSVAEQVDEVCVAIANRVVRKLSTDKKADRKLIEINEHSAKWRHSNAEKRTLVLFEWIHSVAN